MHKIQHFCTNMDIQFKSYEINLNLRNKIFIIELMIYLSYLIAKIHQLKRNLFSINHYQKQNEIQLKYVNRMCWILHSAVWFAIIFCSNQIIFCIIWSIFKKVFSYIDKEQFGLLIKIGLIKLLLVDILNSGVANPSLSLTLHLFN